MENRRDKTGGRNPGEIKPPENTTTALILGGYRQSLTVIRSLGRAGFRVVLGTDKEGESAEYSRHVVEIWRHPPIKSNPDSFIASLKIFVAERPDISIVFPVGESRLECLARRIDEIPFRSKLVMTDPWMLLKCLDKTGLSRIASESGVPSPESFFAHDRSEIQMISEQIGYPCIVKPNTSLKKFNDKKAIICRSFSDLQDIFDSWPEGNEFLIVQKYIQGERHNCHFAATNGRLRAYFQWVTSRTDRIDNTGIGVEGISVRPNPMIEDYCKHLLERLNYTGVGCIQFIIDEKTHVAYFLELNPRLGATCAFPYRLGVDLPKMAVECALPREEEDYPPVGGWTYPIGKRVHWLLGDLEGLEDGIKNREVGFITAVQWIWQMVKAFAQADVHVTWDFRDPMPTILGYAKYVASHFRRLKRFVIIQNCQD